MAKKLRKLGEITTDLEKVLEEFSYDHDMQHGEVLALVHAWLQIHAPSQKEEYLDGESPTFYYGPKRKR